MDVDVGDENHTTSPLTLQTTTHSFEELPLDAPAQKTVNLYKVDNYTFGTKQSTQKQHERNPQHLKEKWVKSRYSKTIIESIL